MREKFSKFLRNKFSKSVAVLLALLMFAQVALIAADGKTLPFSIEANAASGDSNVIVTEENYRIAGFPSMYDGWNGSMEFLVGDTYQIRMCPDWINGSSELTIWSDDESVVSVDGDIITAVKEGETQIHAGYGDFLVSLDIYIYSEFSHRTERADIRYADGYNYYVNLDDEAVIFSYVGDETSVVIPASLKGYTVTTIGYRAFDGNDEVKKVVLPDTIRVIEGEAFFSNSSLETLVLNEGLEIIYPDAINYCTRLQALNIPSTVSQIGNIEGEAISLRGLGSLESLTVASGNPYFAAEGNALYSADRKTVYFVSGSINNEVCLPAEVEVIGMDALEDEMLTSITVEDGNPNYSGLNGMLCSKDGTELILCPNGVTEVVVPDSVETIGADAFFDCGLLENVDLANVKEIDSWAFSGCDSLRSITLPDTLETINNGAFGSCYALREITIPASVTCLDIGSFKYCYMLEAINVDSGNPVYSTEADGSVTYMENGKKVLYLVPPGTYGYYNVADDIDIIGTGAFDDTDLIAGVGIPASVEEIRSYAFDFNENLGEITFHGDGSGLTIMEEAFSGVYNGYFYFAFADGSNTAAQNYADTYGIPVGEPTATGNNIGELSHTSLSLGRDEYTYIQFTPNSDEYSVSWFDCPSVNGYNRNLGYWLDYNRYISFGVDYYDDYTVCVYPQVPGFGYVYVFCNSGAMRIDVTVESIPVEEVSIWRDELVIGEGETFVFSDFYCTPENATLPVEWVSGDESIVKVLTGDVFDSFYSVKIRGLSKGTTELSAFCDGVFLGSIPVEVKDAITEFELASYDITLRPGQYFDLDPVITPASRQDEPLEYSSSNWRVADIDYDHPNRINGIAAGVTYIDVTAGNITKTVKVTVVSDEIEDIFFAVDPMHFFTEEDSRWSIYPQFVPSTSAVSDVTFVSSDESVLQIDEENLFVPVGEGECTITATVGEHSASCTVIVDGCARYVDILLDELEMKVGESQTLGAVSSPEGYEDQFVWESFDKSVATVDQNGVVTAVGEGQTMLILRASDGDYTHSDFITINVTSGTISGEDNAINVLGLYNNYLELLVGDEFEILAVSDYGKDYTYTSSDESVATVDKNGIISAVAPGNCYISVQIGDKIERFGLEVSTIMMDISNYYEILLGESAQLGYKVAPGYTVEFTSQMPQIISVSQDGLATADSYIDGSVIVTATTGNDSVEYTVAPARVTLDQIVTTIEVGETVQLTYSQSDMLNAPEFVNEYPEIITLTEDGMITAVAPGIATISSDMGWISVFAVIIVREPATGLEISRSALELDLRDHFELEATIVPEDTTDYIIWTSSNEDVAKVFDGIVYARSYGTTVITAECGDLTAECVVTVKAPGATGITLDKTSLLLDVDSTYGLTASVEPAGHTEPIVWTSSDENVVTVVDGIVTAVAPGTATITATVGSVSTTCKVTVPTPLVITKQPVDVTVREGETAEATFTVEGDGLTYKWYMANKGATKFTLTNTFTGNSYSAIMNMDRDGRRVYCVVTDQYGRSVTTDTVTLSLEKTPLEIIAQPVDVTVALGETAAAAVEAQGDGLTYKWYYAEKGSSTFKLTTSFTGNTYSVDMTAARDGRQVYCVITDRYGNSVKSDIATLSLTKTPLQIITQPADVTVGAGETAAATVEVQGDGLTYKWYYASKGSSSFALTTTFTGDTYSIEMTAARDGRQVYCVITDAYGDKVTTDTVTLSIEKTPLQIVTQPADVTVGAGETAAATVEAQGDGLTYKWYYAEKGSSTFKVTTSFTGDTYSVEMTAARDGRQVYCVITDAYGDKVTTDTVTLSIEKTPLQIVTQPADAAVYTGETAAATVGVQGDGLTYKWYYAEKGSSTFKLTTSFTGDTYSVEMTAARDGRRVYCVITDAYGDKVTSEIVTLSIVPTPLEITRQPEDATVALGQNINISFEASGDGLTYKWYYANAGDTEFTYTSSFTGTKYTTTLTKERIGRQVYCVVTDKYGNSVQTDTVTMKQGTVLTITDQPENARVCLGDMATVIVGAEGDGLTYKWYYAEKGSSTFRYTSSFSGPHYSIEMTSARNGRRVYCVVTDKYGKSETSDIVTLNMMTLLSITQQPVDTTVANGQTVDITVKAVGDGLSYKWYYANKGETQFTRTTTFTSNYYTTQMNAERDGRQVYCVISDKYGNSIQTDTVTMKAGTQIKITQQPESVAVEAGQMASATVTAQGDGLTYKWYYAEKGSSTFKYTSSFPGDTYSIEMTSTRNGRRVYCVVTDQYGKSVTSETVTLSLYTPLQIVTQPTSVTVASGKTAKVTFKAQGDGLTYKWYYAEKGSDEFKLTTSFTSYSYSVSMTSARAGRQIYCVVTDKYGNSVQTDTVTLNMA